MEEVDEARLRQMLEHLPFFAVMIDRERRFLWVNRVDETLTLAQVLASRVDDYVHASSLPSALERIEHAFESGEVTYYEARAYGQGETATWYGTNVVPLPAARPSEARALLLSNDVTQRKLAEEALRASERRFRRLTEAIPDFICIVDREQHVLYVNREPQPGTGLTRDGILSVRVGDLAHPDDRARAEAAVERVFISGEPVFYEVRGARSGRFFACRVIPLDGDGEEPRALLLVADVTEERRTEEERAELQARLRQSQKMESLGQLAGGVAHDFNNLLLVMRSHLELAHRALERGLDARGEIDGAGAAIDRAQELTGRLLAIARRQPRRPERVELVAFARRATELFARVMPESLSLVIEADDAPLHASVDPGQLEQALLNLCLNARDAIEGPGVIRLRVRRAEAPPEGEVARGVEVSVIDTGAGMDDATLARALEPFFTTKPPGRGTGLGLALVDGIVASHQGRVAVTSARGAGTTVTLWFPEAEDEEEAAVAPAPAATAGAASRGETLLVAEDDPHVRRVVRRLLEGAGYRVIEAEDGARAVELFTAHADEIDLCLLDVVMPKLTGREAYEAIAAIDPEVPAVFTSGYAADVLDADWLAERGRTLLSKPYGAAALLEAVGRALAGAR